MSYNVKKIKKLFKRTKTTKQTEEERKFRDRVHFVNDRGTKKEEDFEIVGGDAGSFV